MGRIATMRAVRRIGDAVSRNRPPRTSPYDASATVTAVDGGTAWVQVDGAAEPMPVAMTIDSKPGDRVRVRVSSSGAHVTGNATAPPTDDAEALAAKVRAQLAKDAADTAQTTAESAQETADDALQAAQDAAASVRNYAWADDDGLHLTLTENEVVDGEANILIDSDSLDVRVGTDVLASYGSTGAIIGTGDISQTVLSDGSLMLLKNGATIFEASDSGVVIGADGVAIATFTATGLTWDVQDTPTLPLTWHASQPAQVASITWDFSTAEDNVYLVYTNDGGLPGTRTIHPLVGGYKSGMLVTAADSASGYRAVYSIEVTTNMLMDLLVYVYIWGTTIGGSKPVPGVFASGYTDATELLGEATIEQLNATSTLNIVGGLTVNETPVSLDGHTHNYYKKPSGGIPKTDLASAVQTSLNLADTVTDKVATESTNGTDTAIIDNAGGTIEFAVTDGTNDVLVTIDTAGITIETTDGTDTSGIAIEPGNVTISNSGIDAGRVMITGASGDVRTSSVTSTELYRLSGVTGNVQSQLDAKLAASAALSWENVSLDDFATIASGWSFVTSGCNVQYNAALGAVRVRLQVQTAAAQTAGSKTLFTVKSAYRPKTFPAAVPSITANAQTAQIWTTGGFSPVVSAISAGTNLQFNGVYFIGS